MPNFDDSVDVSATNPSGGDVSIYKVSSAFGTPVPGTTSENTVWVNQQTLVPDDRLTLVIPASMAGVYHIKLDGAAGVTRTLDVTVIQPVISLSSYSGSVGLSVTVTGDNFHASTAITSITFNSATQTTIPASITTNTAGHFSATFNIPSFADGPYTVTANDGTSTASKTFTITSIHVTPENPIGVFASIGAIGLAFGAFIAVKRSKGAAKPSISI